MTLHLIHVYGMPIFEQLVLEEALLRSDSRDFCLINEGSSPAIVMGISGKAEELVDLERLQIPLIRRFSGGGTVVVDEETIFVTFIRNKTFAAFPEPILRWSGEIYQNAFPQIALRDNDYVIGARKCGGNAQYIKKDRWLHHTSLLWDYDPARMGLLLHPKKTPAYRQGRSHEEFVTRLKDHFPSKEEWVARFKASLRAQFAVEEVESETLAPLLQQDFRQGTVFIDLAKDADF